MPEGAPEVPRPSLDTPRAGHTEADHVQFRPVSQPAVAAGELPEGLTFLRRLARLQLRASRLQGHFSSAEVRPARLGGRAQLPTNLRLREGREEGGCVTSTAHPSWDSLRGLLGYRGLKELSPRRHRRIRTPPVLLGASSPGQGEAVGVPGVGRRGGGRGTREFL